ncbi:MAG: hypothetical protein K1000chlam2_01065 [Chlamydiae bacterium]|nr:hypothetical protein [Chlamydiota bacterium]
MIRIFLALCLFSLAANVFWFYSDNHFRPKNFQPPVEIITTTLSLEPAAGPYTYLGHGRQTIAFESRDKTQVLKLFYWKYPIRKQWYCRVENWLRFSTPVWIYKAAKKKGDLKKLFTRYTWGFESLREETGLLDIHFAKTTSPVPITLIDREGKTHHLNLADFPYVLQKKAILLTDYLSSRELEEPINALRQFFIKRIQMGYIDNPEVFAKNYGFIDDKPVQIDVGKLEKDPNPDVEKECEKVFNNLDKYLRKFTGPK